MRFVMRRGSFLLVLVVACLTEKDLWEPPLGRTTVSCGSLLLIAHFSFGTTTTMQVSFDSDALDDQALDAAWERIVALEVSRAEQRRQDQEELDAVLAFSLFEHDARSLIDMPTRDIQTKAPVTSDGKPEPICLCCLTPLVQLEARRVMPCGHMYCVKCIRTRCKMSLYDRSLAPAHCCKKEYPIEYVKEALGSDAATYERFVVERGWRNLDLQSDVEYGNNVRLLNYKQCPACGVGVERIDGCNHMTCLRGHPFCYNCGQASCHCPTR